MIQQSKESETNQLEGEKPAPNNEPAARPQELVGEREAMNDDEQEMDEMLMVMKPQGEPQHMFIPLVCPWPLR